MCFYFKAVTKNAFYRYRNGDLNELGQFEQTQLGQVNTHFVITLLILILTDEITFDGFHVFSTVFESLFFMIKQQNSKSALHCLKFHICEMELFLKYGVRGL